MSTDTNLLTSPVGSLVFMAVENPVKETNGKLRYSARLEFDLKTDKDWLAQVASINKKKVVTEKNYQGESEKIAAILAKGKALVSAGTDFKPICYDAEGNELEENPLFFRDSTGTAQMIVQPYRGEKGGTINLIGLIVHSIENPEGSSSTDRETRLAQLRAAVTAATK